MVWQDILVTCGQICFIVVELIVVFSGKHEKPKRRACFMTAFWLYAFLAMYVSYDLWFSFGTCLTNAILHTIIGFQKRGKNVT